MSDILQMFPGKYHAILLFLAIGSPFSHSAPLTFQAHNFAIEIPVTWQSLNPPPPQVLLATQTPDGLKTVWISTMKIPAQELTTASRDMKKAAQQSAIDKGWRITSENQLSLGGMPFQSLAAEVSKTSSIVTYVGVAGQNGYVLQATHKAGNAGTDEEIQAVVGSFRLLVTPPVVTDEGRNNSAAYRQGQALGILLVLALLGACILQVFRWVTRKR